MSSTIKIQSKRLCTLIALAVMALSTSACVVIEDGEVGVAKSFGAIADEPLSQGLT